MYVTYSILCAVWPGYIWTASIALGAVVVYFQTLKYGYLTNQDTPLIRTLTNQDIPLIRTPTTH